MYGKKFLMIHSQVIETKKAKLKTIFSSRCSSVYFLCECKTDLAKRGYQLDLRGEITTTVYRIYYVKTCCRNKIIIRWINSNFYEFYSEKTYHEKYSYKNA